MNKNSLKISKDLSRNNTRNQRGFSQGFREIQSPQTSHRGRAGRPPLPPYPSLSIPTNFLEKVWKKPYLIQCVVEFSFLPLFFFKNTDDPRLKNYLASHDTKAIHFLFELPEEPPKYGFLSFLDIVIDRTNVNIGFNVDFLIFLKIIAQKYVDLIQLDMDRNAVKMIRENMGQNESFNQIVEYFMDLDLLEEILMIFEKWRKFFERMSSR